MNLRDERNPYAPPTAHEPPPEADRDEMLIPAGLGERFFARFIDGLLGSVLAIPIVFFIILRDQDFAKASQNPLLGLMFFAATLPVSIYQWSLIARTGQSLGKKWLNIRIVKTDGAPVDFVSGVALRDWVTTVIGFIPVVGGLINFVGILLIFGQERRCLHDRIAGTRVVAAFRA
jgi:uncharacterized RDD family membrane protein YckC